MPETPQPLTVVEALIPIVSLILLIAVFIGWRQGHTREAAVASVSSGLGAIVILLAVGSDRRLGPQRHAAGDGLLRPAAALPGLQDSRKPPQAPDGTAG
jgi:hypothetical protein